MLFYEQKSCQIDFTFNDIYFQYSNPIGTYPNEDHHLTERNFNYSNQLNWLNFSLITS